MILFGPIAAHTLILPFTGYAMPRYAVEAMALGFVVMGAGLVSLWRSVARGAVAER